MPDQPIDQTLEGLINRYRGGDKSAVVAILSRIERKFRFLAVRILQHNPRVARWVEVDDLMQSATLRLLRSLMTVMPDSEGDLIGLVALQLRREIVDLARHHLGPLGNAAHHESLGAVGTSIFEHHPQSKEDDDAKWSLFHQLIQQLPNEERETVSLVFYHGWTQEQVAQQFAVSVRTVRRWWSSAQEKLKAAIGDEMPLE